MLLDDAEVAVVFVEVVNDEWEGGVPGGVARLLRIPYGRHHVCHRPVHLRLLHLLDPVRVQPIKWSVS